MIKEDQILMVQYKNSDDGLYHIFIDYHGVSVDRCVGKKMPPKMAQAFLHEVSKQLYEEGFFDEVFGDDGDKH